MLVSFVFALLGTFLFMSVLERIKFKDAIFIPLVGLMFGNIISSISTFLAYRHDLIQNMSSWMQCDFSMIMSGNYVLMFVSIRLLIIVFFYAIFFTIVGIVDDFREYL